MAPTIVASSPMQRCRKPPIFAFAYISPARSSKRRIKSIFSSTARHVSVSGREWLGRSATASAAASPP